MDHGSDWANNPKFSSKSGRSQTNGTPTITIDSNGQTEFSGFENSGLMVITPKDGKLGVSLDQLISVVETFREAKEREMSGFIEKYKELKYRSGYKHKKSKKRK